MYLNPPDSIADLTEQVAKLLLDDFGGVTADGNQANAAFFLDSILRPGDKSIDVKRREYYGRRLQVAANHARTYAETYFSSIEFIAGPGAGAVIMLDGISKRDPGAIMGAAVGVLVPGTPQVISGLLKRLPDGLTKRVTRLQFPGKKALEIPSELIYTLIRKSDTDRVKILAQVEKLDDSKAAQKYLERVLGDAPKRVPNWAEFERLAFGHAPNKAPFRFPWSEGNWGTRIVDDFVPSTGTIQEATKLKWSRLNLVNPHTDDFVRFTEKLKQAELDGWLLRNDPRVNQVIWYGTEALPTTGRAAELTRLLQQNGIIYRVIEIP